MSAIVSAIRNTLRRYDPIRTTESQIEVNRENGKVVLTGHVATTIIKQMAGRLTYGVAGVDEVENRLVADTELEQAVALALATDERTRLTTERIKIHVWLGHVVLSGPVLSEEAVKAAEEAVRAVPGVIEVTNQLEVSEALRAEVEARERARREAQEAAARAAAEAAEAAKKAAAAAAAPAVAAADLPGWALKPKSEWSKEDFKAFAVAKRAAKKGEGPPVEELLKAGEAVRSGAAVPAAPVADLPGWALKPKSEWSKEDFKAFAVAKRAAKKGEGPPVEELLKEGEAVRSGAAVPAAPVADLPSWALKPKSEWSKEDFKAFAVAKRAAKKGEGPPVEELLKAGEKARAAGAVAAPAEESAPAAASDLPSWATKPKSQWSKAEFRGYAKAKRAAKQSGEELPPIPEE
jgi:osmotically-inducible protein OsmY